MDLEIHTTHTAHSTAARRHAAGASVFLRHFGHMASFSGGASAQVNCYAKCGATEGGRSWAVRAGPQGIERLVNSRAALLAGELIEHGVNPLLRSSSDCQGLRNPLAGTCQRQQNKGARCGPGFGAGGLGPLDVPQKPTTAPGSMKNRRWRVSAAPVMQDISGILWIVVLGLYLSSEGVGF